MIAIFLCIIFSVWALFNILVLFSFPSALDFPVRILIIMTLASSADIAGFIAFHDDEVSHCCCPIITKEASK